MTPADPDPAPADPLFAEKQRVNERVRLLAGNIDRASTACFTVGVATPAAGWLYNVSGLQTSLSLAVLGLGVLGWLAAAILLHCLARRLLNGLLP
ncbi:hypothetical protein M446_6285 [Methylobacterium sp. 4-46]|uniref:hypothetical protein n=1 Tax=unclassified Methylobacterium TaxID=2615210 RepID=UPI000152CBFE|nr:MULTISPECIES: hypothetical protein [Methylobacterium]ACA20551.1 hypothetical protein M446_6285 [Methylobacterium sp. 4-46]WFT79718.1 hypothetical protein QA634_31750 [Methylobacterium nodulans]